MARENRCWKENYLCTGENFVKGISIGDCGDTRTLEEWVKKLYPEKNDEVRERFKYANGKTVTEYIYRTTWKRLVKA